MPLLLVGYLVGGFMATSDKKVLDIETKEENDTSVIKEEVEIKEDTKEIVEVKEKKAQPKVEIKEADDGIVDINIESIKRKKFRLNGDPNKVIELNMSDLGLYTRLEKGYAKLQEIATEVSDVEFDPMNDSIEELDKAMAVLDTLNVAMKEQIDYIFDYPVADKACDGGTMYDPCGGTLRYEHILEVLLGLYENNIIKEFKTMKTNMSKHTAKYTNNRAGRRAAAKNK